MTKIFMVSGGANGITDTSHGAEMLAYHSIREGVGRDESYVTSQMFGCDSFESVVATENGYRIRKRRIAEVYVMSEADVAEVIQNASYADDEDEDGYDEGEDLFGIDDEDEEDEDYYEDEDDEDCYEDEDDDDCYEDEDEDDND